MSKFIGRKADVGLGKEVVRGTPVSASWWIPKSDLTYERMANHVVDESSVSVIEDSIDQVVTEKFAEGTLECIARDKSMGLLLLATFGQVTTALDDPESGVNSHSFSPKQDAQSQSLSLSLKEPNVSLRFPLVMVNQLQIEAVIQDFVKLTADFRSKTWSDGTVGTPDYATTPDYAFKADHATMKLANDLSGLGIATPTPIRRISLTISKNIEDDHNLGSLNPTDILNKQFVVEGEIEMLYDSTNATLKDDMEDSNAKAMRIEIINDGVTIGATENPRLVIDMAKVKYTTTETPFGNDDLVLMTVSFKSFYSLADGSSIEATLYNTVTAY